MKKFMKALIAALAVVIIAVTFAGCTVNVSGKTFVYDEVQVETETDDLTTIEQGLLTTAKGVVEAAVKNIEITFNEDGSVTTNGTTAGTWTQEDDQVTVGATTYTVNGSKLEYGYNQSDFKFIVVLKQK